MNYKVQLNKRKTGENIYFLIEQSKYTREDIADYDKLKKNIPRFSGNKISARSLSISYVKFNEELIIELIDGCAEFFKEFCEWVYQENYDEARWNYVEYFSSPVYDEIDFVRNSLGLTAFDEMG